MRASGRRRAGFPDEVFARMAELGLLGLKYPVEYGGRGGGYLEDAVLNEELARCGSGGLAAGSGRTSGSRRRRSGSSARTTRRSASSRRRSAASASPRSASPSRARAPTWPASARFARRVDGGYVVNGSKTFITNGVRADFVVTAVKTTEEGGHHGHLLPGHRARDGRLRGLEEAREARLARLRHRRARLRRRVRARGEPARRGEPRLLPDHGQLPVGAAASWRSARWRRWRWCCERVRRGASRAAAGATRSPRWRSSTRPRAASPTTRSACSRAGTTRSAR